MSKSQKNLLLVILLLSLISSNCFLIYSITNTKREIIQIQNNRIDTLFVKSNRVESASINRKISEPSYFRGDNYLSVDKEETNFYLVTKPGIITDSRGVIQYYLTGDEGKYYYQIGLKKGNYSFQTKYEPKDNLQFVIDQNGVYKLGYQESHPYFMVYKDSL